LVALVNERHPLGSGSGALAGRGREG
jgi:hypothetical protein